MGQSCISRDTYESMRNTSAEWYKNTSEYTSKKYNEASEYLGP